jgi:hypothetical protein
MNVLEDETSGTHSNDVRIIRTFILCAEYNPQHISAKLSVHHFQ